MDILICAATKFEIEPTLQLIQQQNLSKKVAVLITDVGLMNTTYRLTKSITFSKPHTMIQAGIAGCFDETIALGTTAVVLRDTLGDMGVVQNNTFTNAFEMGLINPHEHPWQNGMLENPNTELIKKADLVLADAVTVNEISTNEDRISYYKNGLGVTCESMEGAAFHFIGMQEEIPFVQLRSFSNYTGERDKEKWQMQLAIKNLNNALQNLLKKLTT